MGVNQGTQSGDVITWLKGLSGALTHVKTEYGSFAEMIEHTDWDDGNTELLIRLVGSVRDHLESIERELVQHVNSKFG